MIIELDEKTFYENIEKGVKIVFFYTTWCGFCIKQNAVLEEMNDIKIYRVNSEKAPFLTSNFGITAFPSFLIFKDGKYINKYSGLHTKFEIMNIISKYI